MSDDDCLKEMMGDDASNQVRNTSGTFRSDMRSAYTETTRSYLETF